MVPTLTRISNVVLVIIVSTSDAQFGFGFRGGLFPGAGRQRSSRFAAYGGYPRASNFLEKDYPIPFNNLDTTKKKTENWPENQFFNRQLPFNFQQKQKKPIQQQFQQPSPPVTRPRVNVFPKTTTTPVPTTTTTPATTARSTENFLPVLRTEKNPYLSIDTKKFPVLAAVPNSDVPLSENLSFSPSPTPVSQRNNAPNNVPSVPEIPAGFSPVPAVPDLPTVSDQEAAPSSIQQSFVSDFSSVPNVPDLPTNAVRIPRRDIENAVEAEVEELKSFASDEKEAKRKQFKKCHGRCVQKFCLPVEDLQVFENCSDKCKGICSQ